MIFDLPPPPKLWVPEKPAIVRAASLKDAGLKEFKPGLFGAGLMLGAQKADPVVTYLGGAAYTSNSTAYATSFSLGTASPDRLIVAIFQTLQLGTNYTNPYCYTFCGVSVTQLGVGASGGSGIIMVQGLVTSGTSGTIGFARAGNMAYGITHVYSITNLESTSPVSTTGAVSAGTTGLLARARGAAIVGLYCQTGDPTSSGISTNKQRTVAGGTGGGFAQNTFHSALTSATTYSVGGGFAHVSASWY
jgi:hypothetical protein